MIKPVCNICGNSVGIRHLVVKERMLGILDEFEYVACPECGHLHLAEIPA